MERLQVKMVDLYYLHRISDIKIEEIAKAMGILIKEGLIRGWDFHMLILMLLLKLKI